MGYSQSKSFVDLCERQHAPYIRDRRASQGLLWYSRPRGTLRGRTARPDTRLRTAVSSAGRAESLGTRASRNCVAYEYESQVEQGTSYGFIFFGQKKHTLELPLQGPGCGGGVHPAPGVPLDVRRRATVGGAPQRSGRSRPAAVL
eukprot:scaffold27806_cov65-Phaeocystis_antarctica.AAC.2